MPAFAAQLAASRPNEVALRDGDRGLGWAEVDEHLRRVANGLLGASLSPSRRVAVFAENAVETVLAQIGGLLGGVSTVPVNFHLTAAELAYILRDSGAEMLFVGPETAERGLEAARDAGVGRVIAWRTSIAGVEPWDEFLAAASDADVPDDIVPRPNLLYTSGTTGTPKGTELPPTMFGDATSVAAHIESVRNNRFAAQGTHLVVGPLYHTGPFSGARTLLAGVPLVVLGRFDPEAVLDAIEAHAVGSSVMVPTHFVRLLALPEDRRARFDPSSLRLIAHTGASCPPDVKRAMIEWWGPVFTEAYGASEVGTVCSISSDEWLLHPGSVGRPVPPFEAVVLDDHELRVAPGVEGRLYFRDATGRGVLYHNDPAKSRAAHVAPGVFTLGEIGYVDADGYVYITDRFSDMVVSGGVNVYPAEAEQVLVTHPAVSDVACIGVPDPEMGERLLALVVLTGAVEAPEPDALIRWCRDRLSHYKCPRAVEFVDGIERNAMGKVNKRQLRAPYWETEAVG
jgi:long-chain acyl-CoA synthetase